MAEFEGEKNLNRETSELEVKGKFKLSEEDLANVAGGCGDDIPKCCGHYMVNSKWMCPNGTWDNVPGGVQCEICAYFVSADPQTVNGIDYNGYCKNQ